MLRRDPNQLTRIGVSVTMSQMVKWLIQKIFGTKNERDLKRLQPFVAAINELEPAVQNLSDSQLSSKTAEFREKLNQGDRIHSLNQSLSQAARTGTERLA